MDEVLVGRPVPAELPPARPPGVQAIGLRKTYGRTQALDGLDLTVPAGEIFGLIGPNGAGKTTTLRILAGLLQADEGQVRIDGVDATRNPRGIRRLVGYMPEDFGLYDDLRVWEYLDFFADCYGLRESERRAVITDLLDLVDLAEKRDAPVDALSRGMRQRLCLAHALIHDPSVLILDEPASGLDPRARVELREILRTLAGMGKTIVISSHILSELAEVCTTIGILHQGRLVAMGGLAAITEQAGGQPLVVRLPSGADPESAALIARRLPGVADVRVESSETAEAEESSDGSALLLDFTGDDRTAAALLTHMVAAGVPICSFARRASTLEDLFLALTSPDEEDTPLPAGETRP